MMTSDDVIRFVSPGLRARCLQHDDKKHVYGERRLMSCGEGMAKHFSVWEYMDECPLHTGQVEQEYETPPTPGHVRETSMNDAPKNQWPDLFNIGGVHSVCRGGCASDNGDAHRRNGALRSTAMCSLEGDKHTQAR